MRKPLSGFPDRDPWRDVRSGSDCEFDKHEQSERRDGSGRLRTDSRSPDNHHWRRELRDEGYLSASGYEVLIGRPKRRDEVFIGFPSPEHAALVTRLTDLSRSIAKG